MIAQNFTILGYTNNNKEMKGGSINEVDDIIAAIVFGTCYFIKFLGTKITQCRN